MSPSAELEVFYESGGSDRSVPPRLLRRPPKVQTANLFGHFGRAQATLHPIKSVDGSLPVK